MVRRRERGMIGRARPRLTEAVRIILQENFFPMTAIDLKKQIEARKLNIQRFANPLAVIHVVLKRLVQSGDVAT
jgi:hypothetical protein